MDESPQSPAAETAPEQQAVEAPTPPQAVADEPQGREYAVGDTVYLDGGAAYIIKEADWRVVVELAEGQVTTGQPVLQNLTRKGFEQALQRDVRNRQFYDSKPPTCKAWMMICGMCWKTACWIMSAGRMWPCWWPPAQATPSLPTTCTILIGNDAETMELETGDTADYRTDPAGVQVEILDKFGTKKAMAWLEVAAVARALAAGWELEQAPAPEVADEPQAGPGRWCDVATWCTWTTRRTPFRAWAKRCPCWYQTTDLQNPPRRRLYQCSRENLYNRLTWDER